MLTNQVAPYLFIIIISSSMYVQSFILLSKNAQLFSLAATLILGGAQMIVRNLMCVISQ